MDNHGNDICRGRGRLDPLCHWESCYGPPGPGLNFLNEDKGD
jgi:hypothetical protein